MLWPVAVRVRQGRCRIARERHDVAVRLNVGTCAVGETDGTPTGEESAIHSLRVYAFVKGQLAGHEFRSGDMETPATFWMDLTMTS